MLIIIQPELAERAVFAAVRRDGATTAEYQHEFARCYQGPDAESRDEAFRALHERWFERLGLRGELTGVAGEFRFMSERSNRLVVREATGRGTQSVELFGAAGRYTVGMTVAVATLLDAPAFRYFARHEFTHIDDMLDPEFGYDESIRPRAAARAAENLLRDRYAVIWGVYCDARIEASGALPPVVRGRRLSEFARAFQFASESAAAVAFDEAWDASRRSRRTHRELVEFAARGFAKTGSVDAPAGAPGPGSSCALCGFSTFDWADPAALQAITPAVRAEYPEWTADAGLCGRCAVLFASRPRSTRLPNNCGAEA